MDGIQVYYVRIKTAVKCNQFCTFTFIKLSQRYDFVVLFILNIKSRNNGQQIKFDNMIVYDPVLCCHDDTVMNTCPFVHCGIRVREGLMA